MEDDLKKRYKYKKEWKTTLKKMEDNLKKMEDTPKKKGKTT